MNDLVKLTARDAVARLKTNEIEPADLIDAAMDRIGEIEGEINALPTICEDRARSNATKLVGDPDQPGWLGGLPVAIKDLSDVAGVRTTYGSPIFTDNVPARSDIMVETMEGRGAVVLAKSNTPEFGAGANTFNEVFGKTRNPWNTSRTCGGSSGGSAVSLAAGEVWLAAGSDLGGSLRTPASFCSVVGLRPSPGRVARSSPNPFETLGVQGPMARNVGDIGLMLDNMAGQHVEDPISLPAPSVPFQTAAETPMAPKRIAYTPDFGFLPVESEVREITANAAQQLQALGAGVTEAHPDLNDAQDIFQTLRASSYAAGIADLLKNHRGLLKPEVIWNTEKGLSLSAEEIARAHVARGRLYQRVVRFFDGYDLLVAPAAAAAPFDIDIRYLAEIDGQPMDSYVDWISITFIITLTACPAISIPCGFTKDGLPVGLQLIAPPRADAALLSMAAAAEEVFGLTGQVPLNPRAPVS